MNTNVTTPENPTLFSATQIARRLGRSPGGVIEAIARLKLKPYAELSSGKYYTEEVIPQVASGMRRKNGASTQG